MLALCPCGGLASVHPSAHRQEVRAKAEARLSQLSALLSEAATLQGLDRVGRLRQEITRTEARKEYERLMQVILPTLQADVWEVRCEVCGAFCWDRDEHYVTALWNKAVARLATLDECCATSPDVRVDYDGMEIVKCETCQRRHLPLKPQA